MKKALVVVGTIAILIGAFTDPGPVVEGILFGVAALCCAIVAFGDQTEIAFFGRRWMYRGDPELSSEGHELHSFGWIFLAVACIVAGIIEVTSYS